MPAPSNDNFANATALSTTLPGSLTGQTNVDASTSYESGEPGFQSAAFSTANGAQSVWYSFTPPSTGRYRFIASGLADGFTTVRACEWTLYSGSAVNALTSIVYGSRTSPNSPNYAYDFWIALEALLTGSTTYYLRMASPWYTAEVANKRTVNFVLDWVSMGNPSAPSNDDFANATDLGTDPTNGIVTSPTTVGATDDSGGFQNNPNYPSVWVKFHCATTESQQIHLVRDGSDEYYIPYWEIYKKNTATPTSWTDLDFVDSATLGSGAPYTDIEDANATISLVSGEDYWLYIVNWLQDGTEGSSDLWFGPLPIPDAATIPLELTASGTEESAGSDLNAVGLIVQPSAVLAFAGVDQATVNLTLSPSAVEEYTRLDSNTISILMTPLGGECFSTFSALQFGEGEASLRWGTDDIRLRWSGDAGLRWSPGTVDVEGINC